MKSKDEIFNALKEILGDLFEVDAAEIRPESRLYEDLDIDSIDAVDMIVKLKELTGKKLQPSDFKKVRTVQDVVDAIHTLLSTEESPAVSG